MKKLYIEQLKALDNGVTTFFNLIDLHGLNKDDENIESLVEKKINSFRVTSFIHGRSWGKKFRIEKSKELGVLTVTRIA